MNRIIPRASAPAVPPPSPRNPWPLARVRERTTALVTSLLGGATAAGLGIGACAVLVMGLWISSPYPDSGPDGALRTAAALWLLAHGADLVRTDGLTGAAVPVGVTPLLLVALPCWLVHRAARDAVGPGPGAVPLAWSGVVTGYLGIVAGTVLYAAGGEPRPSAVSVAVHVPPLVALAAAVGVWAAYGRPRPSWPPARPSWARRVAPLRDRPRDAAVRDRLRVAVRAAGVGALVLVGGGALAVAGSLLWHGAAVQESFPQLTGGWSGRLTVLLLSLALVPNAAVWGAAYALGPGFLLGAAHPVTPFVPGYEGPLPSFPLLAAVPGAGGGWEWVSWATLVVPVGAGVAVAWFVVRGDGEVVPGRGRAALRALEAAVWAGGMVAGLAVVAGGPLGVGGLARFGPVWWQTGAAAVAWTAVVAVPLAAALAGRLRSRF
ncbi:DUF6350 family protein [Streptomyces uncialis]|uniref:cell division protein PerM n=1 Tax=Streptomyces uncialis TaxID=1048205 RepID=UPI002E308BC1|nr:DUF6350 family protein [Streptomyces uncialis]